jgi:CRP/FNR family transcriptional regulator, cyclic AMP receptor protein
LPPLSFFDTGVPSPPMIPDGKLKTGQRPAQLTIRSFKPGDILFEEGSKGREMFIINEGKVGIFKATPDGIVELAQIEKGGAIGEMSLLDAMPRSATAKAVEPTKALLINEFTFQQAVQSIPAWLNSIIKIIVNRLRDANKRVDQSPLRDRERGLVSLILLLLPAYKHEFAGNLAIDYNLVCVEAYYVCRLRKTDIVKAIDQLVRRSLFSLEEDAQHKKHLCVKDVEVLSLFQEYCNLKAQQKTFREMSIPDDAIAMLSNIAYVAQKSGTETDEGTELSRQALIADQEGTPAINIDKSLFELRRRGLINMLPIENDMQILYRKETLSRIKKIKEWLPRFEATPGT